MISRIRLNALLTAVLEQEGVCEIGENIAVPPATFNAIYLLRHAAVHYQKEGIAVRHLCDWACFLERHGHEIDRQLFHKALADYRLDGRRRPVSGRRSSGAGLRCGHA